MQICDHLLTSLPSPKSRIGEIRADRGFSILQARFRFRRCRERPELLDRVERIRQPARRADRLVTPNS